MSDQATTVAELRHLVESFVAERDWHQFHSPKNLSMALAIEAAELMEHFQWVTIDASRRAAANDDHREEIANELADVFCYVLAMANELDLDLSKAMRRKMKLNIAKYPTDEFRGRYGPTDDREV